MGLLDSVLGSVMGQQPQGDGTAAAGAGLGGLFSMAMSNPQLLQAITGMLGNDGEHGGLGGLVQRFQQAGLGDVIGSWIGHGQNQPVTSQQITDVLGEGTIAGLAQKLGMNPDTASEQLSNILPGLIDHLTPNGHAPAQGLGESSNLMGMFGLSAPE